MAITFPFLWQVNANGSVSGLPGNQTTGNMNLTFTGSPTTDDSFVFTGQLELAGETTNISGSYDGVGKMITFTRLLDTGSTQTYVGFLGDNNVNSLIFGGSFTESDVPGNGLRTQFGWFAIQGTPIQ